MVDFTIHNADLVSICDNNVGKSVITLFDKVMIAQFNQAFVVDKKT